MDAYRTAQEPSVVLHHVLVNDAGQFLVWPAERCIPAGWREAGIAGTVTQCLAHLERRWSRLDG